MAFKEGDYTNISYLGTVGATAKNIYLVGSTSNDVRPIAISIYDVTICNQTGTGGEIVIESDVATAGNSVTIFASAHQTVNVSREIPFTWHYLGTTGLQQTLTVTAFAGAGVKTYIGAILQ